MIGTMVNKYKVLRLLGQGGMGEVYEAVDESLERKVAIKILLPEYAKDAEIVGRFFNEARSVNMINHPGLVQIFEFGSLPEGGAFLVMEYIAGISLRDHMKRGDPLSEMEVLQICLQLASALAATHEKGIVHRDTYEKTMTCFLVSAKDAHRRRTSHGYSEAEDSSYSQLQLVKSYY